MCWSKASFVKTIYFSFRSGDLKNEVHLASFRSVYLWFLSKYTYSMNNSSSLMFSSDKCICKFCWLRERHPCIPKIRLSYLMMYCIHWKHARMAMCNKYPHRTFKYFDQIKLLCTALFYKHSKNTFHACLYQSFNRR